MKAVFVDTHYWLAVTRPNDQWGPGARAAKSTLGEVRLVTTDEVLVEFPERLGLRWRPTTATRD